jgi:predicted NUDIX family NTP pyrophosphohydrolase
MQSFPEIDRAEWFTLTAQFNLGTSSAVQAVPLLLTLMPSEAT